MVDQSVTAGVHRGARHPRRAGAAGSQHPGGAPLRQPVPRYRLGEVRHRPGARDGRRQQGRRPARSALYADGVNVHAFLIPRAEFRRMVEGSVQNSFMHSLLAKGRLLYTHDETIARLCDGLRELGARDQADPAPARGDRSAPGRLQGAQVAHHARRPRLHRALDPLRGDVAGPDRSHRRGHGGGPRSHPAGDEAQPRPLRDDLHRPAECEEDAGRASWRPSRRSIATSPRARPSLFAPVVAYLREAGEARSCAEIENHFKRHFDVSERDDGVRVPGGSGTDRQGVTPGAADEEEQRRRPGAGVRAPRATRPTSPRRPQDDEWTPR